MSRTAQEDLLPTTSSSSSLNDISHESRVKRGGHPNGACETLRFIHQLCASPDACSITTPQCVGVNMSCREARN